MNRLLCTPNFPPAGEDVEEGANFATAAADDASKASKLKRLTKALAVATPSKPDEQKEKRRLSSAYKLISVLLMRGS
ncbi:hypothetical protein Tco_0711920 [Tanacetum coccineum]